jgi:arsenate reductase
MIRKPQESGTVPPGITIYHNPRCGTSRSTLALIRDAGIEPTIIEYLTTPPDRATLADLLRRMGLSARALLRDKEPLFSELGLAGAHWSEQQLIEQMLAHPILINRPIVVTPLGVRLCRPAEVVREILPQKKGSVPKDTR